MRHTIPVLISFLITVAGAFPLNASAVASALPADHYLIAIGTTPGAPIGNVDDTASGAVACTLRDAAGIVTAGTTTGPVNGCDITPIGAPDPGNPVYVVNYPVGLVYTIDMGNLRDEIQIAYHPVHIIGTSPGTDIIQGDNTLPPGSGSRMFNFFQSNSRLSNLTLRYGDGRGREGGTLINRAGELMLENVRVYGTDNAAAGAGLANTTNGTMNIIANSIIGDENEPNRITGTIGAFGGAGILNWNGNMLIEDSTVHYNSSDQNRDGGGIDNAGGTLTVRNSTIANNSLTNVTGSAHGAGIHNRGILNLVGGRIHGNSTNGDGGGIYGDFSSRITVSGGAVIGGPGTPNHASEGGGIYNNAPTLFGGFVSILDGEISHNTTQRGGGGIFNNAGTVDIGTDGGFVSISNNVAGSIFGGGIHNAGGVINITNTTLDNNQAIIGFGQGGGIFNSAPFGGAGTAVINVSDSSLNANQARVGGGIYNAGPGAVVTLSATRVTNNTTLGGGAGVANLSGAQLIIQNDSTVGGTGNGNQAGFNGGGIFNLGADTMLSDSEVSHNISANGHGAGVYHAAQLAADGSVEVAAMMTLFNSRVSDNQAVNAGLFSPDGGGVYNLGASLIIMDTTLYGNIAAGKGGGLVNEDGNVSVTGGTISGNQSGEDGGGLFNQTRFGFGTQTTRTSILGTSLLNNDAGGDGGAIYNEAIIFGKQAEVTVNNARIGNVGNANNAVRGGAIYNATANTFLDPTSARVAVFASYIASNSSGVFHSNATTRVTFSCIEGNGAGFINDTPDAVQNAQNNWWGAADGPSDLGGSTADGTGDGVTAGVDFADFGTRGCVINQEGGFVTGGGWIHSPAGAYVADSTLVGKASFGFVAKYNKGQNVPAGNTEFQFRTGDLKFKSSAYDWLLVAGAKAIIKGSGTINGDGNYGFQLSAVDAALTPSTDVDLFRIKIWDKDNGDGLVYDNNIDTADGTDPATALGGGSIVIHKK